MQLRFLGATSTVTGSRTLVEAGGSRVLVDCGLFQGYKPLRLRNWAPLPLDPHSLDALLLTHAHLDHSGWLPRLARAGYTGAVYCTAATRDLCAILLPDAGRLQEEEAGYANAVGSSRHHPAAPLFTEADAQRCLAQLRPVDFDTWFEPAPGLRARFRAQGHILGAAALTLDDGEHRVLFSGDVGRPDDPVMFAPQAPDDAHVIVVESTYGDRAHPPSAPRAELVAALKPVLRRGGVAVVPAFAVGRAQLLLHLLAEAMHDGDLPPVPVYLNSPMASEATGLYQRHASLHRIGAAALQRMSERTTIVGSVEESKALNRRHGPMVIVSASGMATGGRVLHHLIAFAPDPRNAIVLSGFQAGGTRGASLAAGARSLRIFGQDVPVGAEVLQLSSASAHADADELLAWLGRAPRAPLQVYVNHGEPAASDALRLRIERELGWRADIPEEGAWLELPPLPAPASPPAPGVAVPATPVA